MKTSDKVLYGLMSAFDALLAIFDFAYGAVLLSCGEWACGALLILAGLAASFGVAISTTIMIKNYLEEIK